MPVSRRGSGSVTLPSGHTLAIHTRTQDEEILPHATKKSVIAMTLSTYRSHVLQDDGRSPEAAREYVSDRKTAPLCACILIGGPDSPSRPKGCA